VVSSAVQFNGIRLDQLRDEEVLFFIRIRGKRSYFRAMYTESLLARFSGLQQFRTISEYPRDADVLIDLNSVERDWLTHDEWTDLARIVDLGEVIRRCRGLRTASYDLSVKLISRAYLFFARYYAAHPQLRLIVAGTVDNYVMDLMHRVGSDRGIAFLGVTGSFMSPDYMLVTMRGEHTRFTVPSDAEVDQVYGSIKQNIGASRTPKQGRALRQAAYDLGSYVYRFLTRHIYQYRLRGKLNYEYIFAPKLRKLSSVDQVLALRYLRMRKDLKLDPSRKYAYIPLHYVPEATIDYWVEDLYHVDYETSLLDTIGKLQQDGFEVILKEHPAFYLARFSSFYEALIAKNCQILTPFVPTAEVFSLVDLVVVWNGSTGIEAIVHQKPLVKVTNSYYGDGIIAELDAARSLPVPDDRMGRQVVRRVLETSFRAG
jgi:hypothetical protein